MNATSKVVSLFNELISEGEKIKQTCKSQYFSGQKKQVSPEMFEEWKTKCLSLLKSTFGSSSPQYDNFATAKFFDYYNSTLVYLGILKGARADLNKGYFFHKDLMLSVNIYDSLLTRVRHYIEKGKLLKAKTILEAVLYEVLKKICENKKLPYQEDEELQSLAATLVRAEVIPQPIEAHLSEVYDLFTHNDRDPDRGELESATGWILSFLNEFLGAQILIIN